MACHLELPVRHAKMGLPEFHLAYPRGRRYRQRLPQLIGKEGKAHESDYDCWNDLMTQKSIGFYGLC